MNSEQTHIIPSQLRCGLDEAGRGPMAGPVCAAAVILPENFDCSLLNDSKKLNARRRDEAMRLIYDQASAWCVAWASAEEIDSINILAASLLAMKRAYEGLFLAMGTMSAEQLAEAGIDVIVDGLYTPDIHARSVRAEPKADGTYPEVMAASILAKTARDRMMERYSWFYPEYGYEKHKGYPTPDHIRALKQNGPSPIQRKTFRLKGEGQLDLF